jgi:hypothetical protein
LAYVHYFSGELRQLRQTTREFLEFAVGNQHMNAIVCAHSFAGLANYEWANLDAAADHLSQVAKFRFGTTLVNYYNVMLILAKTQLAQGAAQKAQMTVEALRAHLLETNSTNFLPALDSFEALLSLLRKDLGPAVQWAQTVRPSDLQETPYLFEFQILTWARILIAHGAVIDLQAVVQHLEELLAAAENRHDTRQTIQILAHLSLAYSWPNGISSLNILAGYWLPSPTPWMPLALETRSGRRHRLNWTNP